jgi:predicted SAM-dependent methyltransferase
MKSFLHVGCGPQNKSGLKGFNSDEWKEIRFDIDESVNPDIQGTLTDMNLVESSSLDAIFSSHNIEHIYAHEVPIALREFNRVLKDDGIVVITCPDLQSVCEAVAKNKLLETLYVSQAGPISPIDILYGHRGFIANGNIYMAHKCGFTYQTLVGAFYEAGFKSNYGGSRSQAFELWLIASKNEKSVKVLKNLAIEFLP